MELKDYLKILTQHKKIIIVLTLLIALAAFLYAYLQPVVYDTSISFTINRTAKQKTADYQYDGYYAIQASNLFAQTIMSWLMTPAFVLEVYQEAGVAPAVQSLDKLGSHFSSQRLSPQNVAVRFKEKDEATAKKIGRALIDKVEKKSSEINKTSEGDSLFNVVGYEPVIAPYKLSVKLATLIGFIVGFLFSCFLVYVVEYFKMQK
jgi:capsular polysaccharide biosynthesis protein